MGKFDPETTHMKSLAIFFILTITCTACFTQNISRPLQSAYRKFETDPQLRHATSSLYVVNAKTGAVLFEKNSMTGLAPASTQKIITSVSAFEILGKNFRYATELGFIDDETLPVICIRPSGDPTFGSRRFKNTEPGLIVQKFYDALENAGVRNITPVFKIDINGFSTKTVPDGWIMQDIGNYYGAGAGALIWRENQYDLALKSGSVVGGKVEIVSLNGDEKAIPNFVNELRSAEKGSGDNAYIYLPVGGNDYYLRGTIPVDESRFTISGAMPEGAAYFVTDFGNYIRTRSSATLERTINNYSYGALPERCRMVYTHYSPTLDSIIYWFNRKSINLYGEALVSSLARAGGAVSGVDSGVARLRKFWKEKGLDDDELNIYDGSGLSPLNRVTTHAQVEILKYAKSRDWFAQFYQSLPEYNGMKMKSGTISGVKGFCGYHRSRDGNEYIFSFLVNNYSGKSSALVEKMYKVLDELK